MCSQSWKSLWVYFRYTHLFSNSDTSAVWLHPLPLLPACISVCVRVCVWAQLLHLCPTLCNPMYFNPSGSSVHGIFPERILEWVVMPSSRGCSQLRDRTHFFCVSCTAGPFFIAEPQGKPRLFLGLLKPPSTETAQWAFNQCQSDTSTLLLKCSQVLLVAAEYEWRSFMICSADLFSYHCVLCTYCPECLLKNLWLGFFLTSGPQGDLPGHSTSITLSPRVTFYCSTWFVFFKSLITLWNYSFICCLNLSISPG